MRVLSAEESATWLKQRQLRSLKTGGGEHWQVMWPEGDPLAIREFATRLAAMADWRSAAMILERPGLPRMGALEDVCSLRQACGYRTTPTDLQLGVAPGHLLDDSPTENRENVRRLLTAMMSGYLEGTLVTKSGRFAAVVGCGVIEFHSRDKSLSGKLRGILRDLHLTTL